MVVTAVGLHSACTSNAFLGVWLEAPSENGKISMLDPEIRMGLQSGGLGWVRRRATSIRSIERATNGQSATVENMSIDHCRLHVFVVEEFLDCSDVIHYHTHEMTKMSETSRLPMTSSGVATNGVQAEPDDNEAGLDASPGPQAAYPPRH